MAVKIGKTTVGIIAVETSHLKSATITIDGKDFSSVTSEVGFKTGDKVKVKEIEVRDDKLVLNIYIDK